MMSNYKVGDLASLLSSSEKKPDTELQSLFKKHWNKRSQDAAKGINNQAEALDCGMESKTAKKKKVHNSASPEGTLKKRIKTDSNVDFISVHNKKKCLTKNNANLEKDLNSSPSEDVVNKKQNVKRSKNHKAFIRCAKNKRQKIVEPNSLDTVNAKDNLFSELSESKNNSSYQSKKRKHHKISLNVPSSVDVENQEVTRKVKDIEKVKLENIQDLPCTLFVGNLPVSVNRKMLHKLFASFGQIKSVRLRGAVSTKMSIPKKVAEIKNDYHKGLQSHTGFVVFKDEESAKNALSLNQTLIDNHHILVDFANKAGEKKLYDNDLSVFLGNLPFDVDDETVRSAFENCGKIQAVRIIRDKNTGLGKGFGYVQFQKIKSKENALTLNNVEIKGRKIRVKPVDGNQGGKTGSKKTLMIRTKKQTKGCSSEKSAKKLLKRGKLVHQKKQVARLFGEKFFK